MWDTIVIGSGISGLTAAAALARCGQRVLVLEQHSVAGGLTQTFQRHDWCFATGVHYVGGVGPDPGPDGQFGRMLHWLTDRRLQFAPCANPYDIVRLPGFEFGISHPQSVFSQALEARFPAQQATIKAWFEQLNAASQSARSLLMMRGLPGWLSWAWRLWYSVEVCRFSDLTLAAALTAIDDPQLRAVLGARGGDYGAPPQTAPLLEHALVTGAYNSGAYYPVGGPARFAQTMQPVIEAAGGMLRLGADVQQIIVTQGRANGVVFQQRGAQRTEEARRVISAMGVINTVACLDAQVAPVWHDTVHALRSGLSYVSLYLGFEGDIAAAGATTANIWIYESDDVGRVWQTPAVEDAPGLFVSFPSLKDPANAGKHTAEVVALCDVQAFGPWLHLPSGERPEGYAVLKAKIEARVLAQFRRHFPALAPLLRFHELSTPVTQQHFVRTPDGAMYGIEMTARRLESAALDVRTPVPGLLLAGQDVSGPGIQAACMSGLLAAAAIEPTLLRDRLGIERN
jgi:all-trans-retinol 13,14-reductase